MVYCKIRESDLFSHRWLFADRQRSRALSYSGFNNWHLWFKLEKKFCAIEQVTFRLSQLIQYSQQRHSISAEFFGKDVFLGCLAVFAPVANLFNTNIYPCIFLPLSQPLCETFDVTFYHLPYSLWPIRYTQHDERWTNIRIPSFDDLNGRAFCMKI